MHIGAVCAQNSGADQRLALFNTGAGSEPTLRLKHGAIDGEVRRDVTADVPRVRTVR